MQPRRLSGAPIAHALSAFSSRDFRWLWANNTLSMLELPMAMLAQGWLVLELTGSPFWVGAVAGVQGLTLLAFGSIGGLLADRMSRRNLLLAVQALRALSLVFLAVMIISGQVALWHLMAVAVVQGIVQAVTMPASGALIYDLVGPRRLLNAMSVRAAAMNVSRIAGSLLVGALLARAGMGTTYTVIAAISIVTPFFLLFLPSKRPAQTERQSWRRNLLEGVRYAVADRPIRSLLFLSMLMEMFGFSFLVMMPVIAKDVLQVGADGLGFLSAANATGSFAGSLLIAASGDLKAKGPLLIVMAAMTGLSILLFALSPWFALSLALSLMVGAFLLTYDTAMQAIVQLLTRDEMRGRVAGLYYLTFGFTPVGGFIAGAVATVASAPIALGMSGAVIMGYVLGLVRRDRELRQAMAASAAAKPVSGGAGDAAPSP